MGDGRTPTLIIAGRGDNSGTVTLEDARSAYPFPAYGGTREYEERWTRQEDEATAGKRVREYQPFAGPEQTLDFSATLVESVMEQLETWWLSPVPTVTVTYLGRTWPGDLVFFSAVPDELGPNDSNGPTEYIVSVRIDRDTEED